MDPWEQGSVAMRAAAMAGRAMLMRSDVMRGEHGSTPSEGQNSLRQRGDRDDQRPRHATNAVGLIYSLFLARSLTTLPSCSHSVSFRSPLSLEWTEHARGAGGIVGLAGCAAETLARRDRTD
jgi:hypothetical protein